MTSRLLLLCVVVCPVLAAGQGVSQSGPPGDSSQIGTGTTLNPSAGPSTGTALSRPHETGNTFFDALEHRGFVGMLLDHRTELQLVGKQITALGALEQEFRLQTDSATRQLDSLRKANSRMTKGLSLHNASINATQLGALLQSQQAIAALGQRVLTAQQQVKKRALVLLTPTQRAQIDALEKQMRQLLNSSLHHKDQGSQSQETTLQQSPVPIQSAH